jgi:hypothetical protein
MVKKFLKSELGQADVPVAGPWAGVCLPGQTAGEFSLIEYYPQLFPSAAPCFAWTVFPALRYPKEFFTFPPTVVSPVLSTRSRLS